MGKVIYEGKNQCERVLSYMKAHTTITQKEADKYLGVSRLPSRVCDLEDMGYVIAREFITVPNRYGEKCRVKQYWIAKYPNHA